jgi:hypothetical protein
MNAVLTLTSIILSIIAYISISASVIFFLKYQDEKNYWKYLLNKNNPYEKKKRLLSPNEAKLYQNLKDLPILKDYLIFAQVPYSAILQVQPDFKIYKQDLKR